MGKYLSEEEQESFRPQLRAYLQEKARRRAAVTSGDVYNRAAEEFKKQEVQRDLGSFVSTLSDSAAMAGPLYKGVGMDSLRKHNDTLADSSQGFFDNMQKLRGIEEQSNMNDLRVADYVAGLEQFDESKKLRREEIAMRQAEAGNERDQRLAMLRENLADKAASRKSALEREAVRGFYRGQGGSSDNLSRDRLNETIRHNKALEAARGAGSGSNGSGLSPGNWQIVGEGEDGTPVLMNTKTGERKLAPDLKGFTSKKEKEAGNRVIKPPTEDERKRGMYADIALKELSRLEEQEQSYRPGGREAVASVLPDKWGNYVRSEADQKYNSANSRIIDPFLRATTGAGVTRQEVEEKLRGYAIMPGDSPGVIKDKQAARREFIQGLIDSAGKGGTGKELPPPPGDEAPPPPPAGAKVKMIAPDGRPGLMPAENVEKALKRGYTRAP